MLKLYFYDPPYFSTADNFYHGQKRSKVNHFGEKLKNPKISSKIMTFQKILTFLTSDFYAGNNSPTCAWPMLLLEKIKKSSKKFGRGWLFQKSRFLTPPTGQKVMNAKFNRHGTKKFVIFSPKPSRMQRIRKFYRVDFENPFRISEGVI